MEMVTEEKDTEEVIKDIGPKLMEKKALDTDQEQDLERVENDAWL